MPAPSGPMKKVSQVLPHTLVANDNSTGKTDLDDKTDHRIKALYWHRS